MIIRREDAELRVITQPDHASLAAAMLEAWTGDEFGGHPRRGVILLATREHDNGWLEEDAATIVSADGSPVDFVAAPAGVKHRVWPRAVRRLAQDDPYAAALVAQHALTVYGAHRAAAEWQPFFSLMASERDALLARCGGSAAATVDEDYRFLNIVDLLSLVFCNGWTEPFERWGRRIVLSGERLHVTPDPFRGACVPLRVRARRVAARPYASAAAFREALDAAAPQVLTGNLTGG